MGRKSIIVSPPKVIRRGPEPWLPVFFGPNHGSAPVPLLQSPMCCTIASPNFSSCYVHRPRNKTSGFKYD